MAPHHWMGVRMSQGTLPQAQHAELRGLLEAIIAGQTAEIERMRGWYRDWYGSEAPQGGPGHCW